MAESAFRTLPWDGLLNARQVLPGLIRSASLSALTPRGRQDLLTSGLGRIIDLRNRSERDQDPAPFEGQMLYLNLPLLPYRNRALNTASVEARTNAEHYCAVLDHVGNSLATIFGAVLDAAPGKVLIHCHAGKDRTGLVTALALELTGVSRRAIAADYVETDQHMQGMYADILARQPDPVKRRRLSAFLVSREQDILCALDHLDQTWGGVATYLEAFGFSRKDQERLVTRLAG
ncbi:tyrosine-protein phosphatase [Deinococcus deserti]|uniref:Protein tyrosine/serine phosphatase n=1 Tax=Deinococcus deserti (strain DSM 17065 / CIP 109153 / LMG 22923 / VCD115) TaxID=546414 RepID=C1D009_DEIDV|nr:tyrosine-protein phosphatase [Deinococcus deserti]ACO45261.1 putative Protein tyrosine/serine phosphatase [Deinococcus deserti VCD115]